MATLESINTLESHPHLDIDAPSDSDVIGYRGGDDTYCISCAAELAPDDTEPPSSDDEPIVLIPIHAPDAHPPEGRLCANCDEQIVDPIWYKPDLYRVVVENTDDDPTQIILTVQGDHAAAWGEYHGSLTGGTWEKADGPDFIYDIGSWTPTLLDEIIALGFKLDLSQYCDPEPSDLVIAEHAATCEACDFDWHRGERHMLVVAPEKLK